MAEDRRLYPIEPFEGEDDYIPDLGGNLASFIERLSRSQGFDLSSTQAHQRSVTATIKFEGIADPMGQAEALQLVLQASTITRCLYANLLAARAELSRLRFEDL